jgi:hypothetical protein
MEHGEPQEPESGQPEADAAEAAYDALRRLEERLDRASDTAERLIAEAAAQAGESAGQETPPAGWQVPEGEQNRGRSRDIEILLRVFQSLRELIPPEVQRKLAEALRELLLAVRALIDWYLERVEQRRSSPTEVQDIPIL